MSPVKALFAILPVCLLALSCASSSTELRDDTSPMALPTDPGPSPTPEPPASTTAPTIAPAAPAPAAACDMFAEPGVVRRTSLVKLLDAGLARWLRGVEGDRVLANHKFQGWLIKSMHPTDPCYREIDLRPGDVVQKVNGKSIEKPEQAFDVAQSLRTAPAIVVDLLRDGKARTVTIPISKT